MGRATFILLKEVANKGFDMQAIKTPENVPRLFDLIQVKDEKLRPAFYSVLRDTLVAEDMDQAVRSACEN